MTSALAELPPDEAERVFVGDPASPDNVRKALAELKPTLSAAEL